jgi:thymidine kinase
MPYLFFNYGTMNSSKTANLLMAAHTLRAQGKHVVLIKPSVDNRAGARMITSRVGLKAVADIVLMPNNAPLGSTYQRVQRGPRGPRSLAVSLAVLNVELPALSIQDTSNKYEALVDSAEIILIDEAQFLSVENVEKLRDIASKQKIPVICYGLLTDYRSKLFPGSKRLVELADSLKEITYDASPSLGDCCWCKTNKAIINSKFNGPNIIKTGSSLPDLGAEEKYRPLCWNCWKKA